MRRTSILEYLLFWRTIRKLRADVAAMESDVSYQRSHRKKLEEENEQLCLEVSSSRSRIENHAKSIFDLQAQLEQENGEKHRLIDEVRELRARISQVEPRLATALERESTAVKAVADWMAQQMFGRKIWGAGVDLPESKVELEPLRRRPTMAEAQREDLNEFFDRAYALACEKQNQ